MKRTMLAAFAAIIMAALAAGVIIESPAAPEEQHPPHAFPPVSAAIQSPPFVDPDVAAAIAAEEAAIAAYLTALHDAEVAAAEAARTAARSGSPGSTCNGDVACFLACTRAHESDTSGGYSAVSPGGTYRGAYQFQQSTWDAAVAGAGHDEYVGVPADQVPAEVQDAAAAHLYSVSGTRPWGGRC
jgi:hypothetical protein